MKFPIGMVAGMAGYIFKNKMRPRPEWQKTVAVAPDAANPFRILHAKTGEGGAGGRAFGGPTHKPPHRQTAGGQNRKGTQHRGQDSHSFCARRPETCERPPFARAPQAHRAHAGICRARVRSNTLARIPNALPTGDRFPNYTMMYSDRGALALNFAEKAVIW